MKNVVIRELKWYVIIAVTIIIVSSLVYMFIQKPPTAYFQEILDNHLAQYKIEYELKIDELNKQIINKDQQLNELLIKLEKNQNIYNKAKKELDVLKGSLKNVKEPKDIIEIKERLRKMGYDIR
jgi:hypothetical protein